MAKTYTAQEMREFADAIAVDLNDNGHRSVEYTHDDLIPVIESLRQAADECYHLRSLVKELTDAMDNVLPETADCADTKNTLCKDGCMPNGICRLSTVRALVARAREEVKK